MNSNKIQFNNLDTYNRVVHEYRKYELNPPERNILSLYKERWHKMSMLDIGVGGGRTSYTFSAIVDKYLGIDYSPPMITECKSVFDENDKLQFEVCDASDLSRYYENKFDFILFSLNGIDSVDHETRLKILAEVRKVIEEDGIFFFSTHSLQGFSTEHNIAPFNRNSLLRSIYSILNDYIFAIRLKRFYRNIDLESIKKRPWAVLITGDHNFKMKVYHINPEYQIKQLMEAGFRVLSVYNREGKVIDPLSIKASGMLYFLCRPV